MGTLPFGAKGMMLLSEPTYLLQLQDVRVAVSFEVLQSRPLHHSIYLQRKRGAHVNSTAVNSGGRQRCAGGIPDSLRLLPASVPT